MNPEIITKLRDSIKRHEGFKHYLYSDSKGIPSIGYGRNLKDNGISETEADIMLGNDIVNATVELYHLLPVARELDDVRKAVLIELTFNMGIEKVLQFRKMIEALNNHDYALASKEMLASQWAEQVHGRAQDLAYAMETGNM